MKTILMKKRLFKILIYPILIFGIFNTNQINSQNSDNNLTTDYLRKRDNKDFYILGPGDSFYLEINQFSKELNGVYTIGPEGTINAKRLNNIYIEGLTINELINLLNEEYLTFVKKPNVRIIMLKYRAIKIYIDGEVSNPGYHVIPGAFNIYSLAERIDDSALSRTPANKINMIRALPDETLGAQDISFYQSKNNYFPSLIDVLRTTGGISINSDLENIKVIRNNSLSKGGGKIKTEINLLNALNLKDSSQNIRVYDGDSIFIPKTEKVGLPKISKAIKSNINPKFINIFVGGEVENPGIIKTSRLSNMIDAIDSAGGPKVLKGPVRFVRYSLEGQSDKRTIRYNRKAKPGTYNNPYLKEGDIIFVGKSNFKITTEVITEITNPFQGMFSAYGLYRAITD